MFLVNILGFGVSVSRSVTLIACDFLPCKTLVVVAHGRVYVEVPALSAEP